MSRSTRSGRAGGPGTARGWTTRDALPGELGAHGNRGRRRRSRVAGTGSAVAALRQRRSAGSSGVRRAPRPPCTSASRPDATHLGHAATYPDLRSGQPDGATAGYQVHYVQNVTDVDDPLFERADRDGVDWRAGRPRDAAVPRRHDRCCACCPRRTTWPPPPPYRRGDRYGREDAGLRRGVYWSTTTRSNRT